MKKIMMLLMIAVLMLGVSGNAMAYFEQGDLVRVVFSTINGTGTEYATDLGLYNNLTSVSPFSTVNLNTSNFTAASVGQANFTNTRVAYFIFDNTMNGGNGGAWTSGALTNSGVAYPLSWNNFQNAPWISGKARAPNQHPTRRLIYLPTLPMRVSIPWADI